MPDSRPEELIQAEQLIYEAKFNEAFEIIENFEKKGTPTEKDTLSALIMKGWIYNYKYQWKEANQIGERVYKESQKIGDLSLTIDALLLKGEPMFHGKLDDALEYVLEAEKKLDVIADDSSSDYIRRKASIFFYKARFYLLKSIYNKALECALQCLEIREKLGRKIDIAYTFQNIAFIYINRGDHNAGLEYAMKSLAIQEELNNRVGIAASLNTVGFAYNFKGNFNQAIEFCKKSLAIEKISNFTKTNVLRNLGIIHQIIGELSQALRYFSQSVELAEKENNNFFLSMNLVQIGGIYEMKDNDSKAIEYYQRSLAVSEKLEHPLVIGLSLWHLISINIDQNSRKQAQQYLERLKELADQTEGREFTHFYLDAKAHFLKTSGRTRDRAKAEILWRQVVNDRISNPAPYIKALGSLCEFLIEELEMSNDSEILNELNPLIMRWHNIAEKTQSHSWLAWAKLFQAKVALIGMKIEEGKKLMTQAQRVAELHGLTRLAQRISYEHDTLLDQINQWKTLKTTDAPISERIKLASTKGVLEHIQGKRDVEPPESVDEQSTVLLIIAEGGILIFSYPFTNEWRIDEDLFSSFLSAFTSFSTEFFSKELDRVKFGDEMMLMESIGSFSFCYLFKGQTYLARQKLTKFIEEIQSNSSLWQSLEQHYKTSQILELKESPQLESLITDIFTSNS